MSSPQPNVSIIPSSSSASGPTAAYRFLPCADCGKLISKWTDICPDCGHPLKPPTRENKYPALHVVAVILKIIAVITFAVDLFLIARSTEAGQAGLTIPWFINMILAPIFTWALAELILLLIDIEDNTSRLRVETAEERKLKAKYRASKIPSLEPEGLIRARLELAKTKLSPDLHAVFQNTNLNVAVQVELKNPINLETFNRHFEYLGFELVDNRPEQDHTIGHKTKLITGYIDVEYLADLALAPTVEKVGPWQPNTD